MRVLDDDPERSWFLPGVFMVRPDLHRMPLPMPADGLRAVNAYVLLEAGRCYLIDPGVAAEESTDALKAGLKVLGLGLNDVEACLVTHIHYDHFSQALRFREDLGIPLAVGEGEWPSLAYLEDERRDPIGQLLRRCRHHGAPEVADRVRSVFGDNYAPLTGLPDTWLEDTGLVRAGGRTLRVIHTPGHTRGHVVFDDEDAGLMFTGDHLLPHITPSIGFEPNPPPLPLRDYLRSLARVLRWPDRTMLPAHGPLTSSTHRRAVDLLEHHRERLTVVAELVVAGEDVTAAGVASEMRWTSSKRSFAELNPLNQLLAVLEAAAHLDVLAAEGRLTSHEADDALVYRA